MPKEERVLTCQTKGKFLIFATTNRITAILLYFPGPVTVLRRNSRKPTRDAPAPSTIEAVNRIGFKGSLAADAMLKYV